MHLSCDHLVETNTIIAGRDLVAVDAVATGGARRSHSNYLNKKNHILYGQKLTQKVSLGLPYGRRNLDVELPKDNLRCAKIFFRHLCSQLYGFNQTLRVSSSLSSTCLAIGSSMVHRRSYDG